MITIESFKKEHVKAVAEIEKACFSSPWSENALSEELTNENAHFLTAFFNGEIAGYLGLHIICGEGYITNIAVLPDYRRHGIAKALITEAFKNDLTFITLEVRKSNLPAISLYKSLGFDEVGERKSFYSNPEENAILMTKHFKEIV